MNSNCTENNTSHEQIHDKNNYITGVIDRFEGNYAVLQINGLKPINWPTNKLPQDAREGSSIRIKISTSSTDTEEREKLAKALLNELLQTDHATKEDS